MEDKSQDPRRYKGLTLETPGPSELFKKCDREEKGSRKRLKEFGKRHFKTIKQELFKKALFESPLFVPAEDESEIKKFLRGIGPAERASYRRLLETCYEHQALLRALRNARDNETRWLILAAWLKHEGIAEPEAFLPSGLLKRRAHRYFRRFSLTRVLYVILVEIWLPYFERLLAEWRALEGKKEIYQIRKILERRGYDSRAVEIFLRRREAIPAVCDWLAMRGETAGHRVNTRTIRNAYSLFQTGLLKLRGFRASQKNRAEFL